jgi:hypothetical protein
MALSERKRGLRTGYKILAMENDLHPTDYEEGRPPKNPHRENSPLGMLRRPVVYIPLLLLAAFLITLMIVNTSKNSQIRDAQEKAAQDREALVASANERITDNTTYLLRTLMMPFAWSVRTAMLSGNVEQVDQYLFQFVQEPNFELLVVADAKGKIISTTNQKYKGEAFESHFNPALLRAEDITLDTSDSASIKMATPIMGLNSKLGTLYAVYKPQEPLTVDRR